MHDDTTRRRFLGRAAALGAGASLGLIGGARADEPPGPLWLYLVRHAEKGEGNDPELTEAGRARAEQLAAILRDVSLGAVYSTSPRRTQLTAAPVAKAHGLEVTTYQPRKGALTGELLQRSGAVLVVGHSNTIPALLRELGIDPGTDELPGYDDLWLLARGPGGQNKLLAQHLHYGARG